jgi:hypothetical protein
MSDEKALIPVEQREVDFYEDTITAVLVEEEEGREEVFVPLRPICNSLGLAWSSQLQRIKRDPVLNDELVSVFVTNTESQRGGRAVQCLPLEMLHGFLFGINASRVKDEIRDRLIRYQRECYRVLADAFMGPYRETAVTPQAAALVQLHEMALAIVETTEELIRIEQRQTAVEDRMDNAARFVGQMNKRLSAVERRIKVGPLTEEQAAEIKKRVNQIAEELTKRDPDKVHYPSIYAALQSEAGVSSYKAIPPAAYEAAVNWLDGWLDAIREAVEEE